MDAKELLEAQARFPCVDSRCLLERGDLVIGRYSVLPFYEEQAHDIEITGAKLINSLREHRYVADLRNWVEDLRELTPETWFRLEDVPPSEPGPFVLKGKTNSRKNNWNTHCFAKDRKAASEVEWRLCMDGLIGMDQQDIYVRKYVPLETFMVGLNGLPITREVRFFVAYGQILCGGFYWQNYVEELPSVPSAEEVPVHFLQEAVSRVWKRIPFFTLDVAKTADGRWIVIELNDGQMSGLSENDPATLYANLRKAVDAFAG